VERVRVQNIDVMGTGGQINDATNDRYDVRITDLALRILSSSTRRNFYKRFGKPILDITLGAMFGMLTLLPLLLITLTVRIAMGSPVLFRQERVGRNGKTFTILKFRTMIPERRRAAIGDYAGPERRQRHKSLQDPRVTPLGKFLRKWSLDELPQLWNVLRGDMSLIGPRPELPVIVQGYKSWQHYRHVVKPGLTGLWQVSDRGNGLMHEHVDVDLVYIIRLSLRTDLLILLKTVPALLGKCRGF
jgi:lipopolysaccharide/colanic/teichoic acid biosynthesis glycosyltransferase